MEEQEYIKVSKKALLNSQKDINLDLYIKRTNPSGTEEYVLFCGADLAARTKQKIAAMSVGVLYVKNENQAEYVRLLEKSISNIADDKDIDIDEKSEIIYSCATEVLQDVFKDPRSGEHIQRSKETVEAMINYSLKEPNAIYSLLSIQKKDYYTFTHCINVSVFAVGLATKAFGITAKDELNQIGVGAIFHDLGKSKIDNKILTKPGKLTPEEFEEIKKHPRYGYDLMNGKLPIRSLDIILHHHEKYNGEGYPDKLSKGDISFAAKIVALADVYDALTTNRSYAKARSPFDAMMTMKNEMLGHFEDQKFLAFIKMLGPKK